MPTTMKKIPLPLKLTLAWLWVAVPLGWGVCQSAIKSAPLFGIDIDSDTTDPATIEPVPHPHDAPKIDLE